MKDGVYLLVMPGDNYGVPYTLKNGNGTQLLAGVDGIKIVSNLPEGAQLIPLVAMTNQRIDALQRLLDGDRYDLPGTLRLKAIVHRILEEVRP